jgi:hypothetical protein
VAIIGNNAFYGCSSLTSIIVGSGNTAYASETGSYLTNQKQKLLRIREEKQGLLIIFLTL